MEKLNKQGSPLLITKLKHPPRPPPSIASLWKKKGIYNAKILSKTSLSKGSGYAHQKLSLLHITTRESRCGTDLSGQK